MTRRPCRGAVRGGGHPLGIAGLRESTARLFQSRAETKIKDTEIDFHEAQMQAFSSELELARMRARRTDIAGAIPTQERFEAAWRFDKQVRDLEGATLDARGEAAKKQKKLAGRAVEINRARKRVWDSQRDLIEQAGAMNN